MQVTLVHLLSVLTYPLTTLEMHHTILNAVEEQRLSVVLLARLLQLHHLTSVKQVCILESTSSLLSAQKEYWEPRKRLLTVLHGNESDYSHLVEPQAYSDIDFYLVLKSLTNMVWYPVYHNAMTRVLSKDSYDCLHFEVTLVCSPSKLILCRHA